MAPPTELSLCAGIGGISLGLRRAIPALRTVCYVERELYAAGVLVRQMQAGALDSAPIWSDLRTFDAGAWRGRVDLVTAGFPCQPHSVAGKRKGTEDERWLFEDIARIVRDVGARAVFLENVPGLVSLGFDRVLGTLADLGLDAEWGVFSAAEVGAPHLRRRLFILAADADCDAIRTQRGGGEPGADSVEPGFDGADGQLARSFSHPWRTEPWVCRVADGLPDRVDRLRALGNAVVPATVELAWRTLAGRMWGDLK